MALRGPAPGPVVYGLMTVGAVLAVESTRQETYLKTATAAVLAPVLYWLADAYADLLGVRVRTGARLSIRGLGGELAAGVGLLVGAAVPLAVVLVGWAVGASLGADIWVAVGVSVAAIAGLEVWAGVRAGARGLELLVEAGIGAALGAGLVALKVLLH